MDGEHLGPLKAAFINLLEDLGVEYIIILCHSSKSRKLRGIHFSHLFSIYHVANGVLGAASPAVKKALALKTPVGAT